MLSTSRCFWLDFSSTEDFLSLPPLLPPCPVEAAFLRLAADMIPLTISLALTSLLGLANPPKLPLEDGK